jgi:hypothetical protein
MPLQQRGKRLLIVGLDEMLQQLTVARVTPRGRAEPWLDELEKAGPGSLRHG